MRILLVEDDPDLSRQLKQALADAGYAVDHAADGEEAHFLGDTEPYDVIVLDLGLPKIDGVSVLERWRREGRTTPVLILTARGAWSDKVSGFDAGADDYLTKPFVAAELKARVAARLRNASPRSRGARRGLVLDRKTRQCRVPGLADPVALTEAEAEVLGHLLAQPYQPIPGRTLCATVLDEPNAAAMKRLIGIIAALCHKIEPDPDHPQYLFALPTASFLLSPLGKGLPELK